MAGGAQVSLMRETDSEADTRATTTLQHPQVKNQFPDQGDIKWANTSRIGIL